MTDEQSMLLGGGIAMLVGLVGLLGGDVWWNPVRLKRSIRERVTPGFSLMFTKVASIILLVLGFVLATLAAMAMAGMVV